MLMDLAFGNKAVSEAPRFHDSKKHVLDRRATALSVLKQDEAVTVIDERIETHMRKDDYLGRSSGNTEFATADGAALETELA